jgi:hypothetical protein
MSRTRISLHRLVGLVLNHCITRNTMIVRVPLLFAFFYNKYSIPGAKKIQLSISVPATQFPK